MARQQNMQAVVDDEGFGALDAEIIANQTKETKRAQSSKYPWMFRMPETADIDGTRKKKIRFITPYSKMASLLVHSEFGKYSVVCPAQYGKDCQYCKKPKEITDKINHTWYIWQVWDYTEGRDGEGDFRIFAWEANQASPVPTLHNMMKDEIEEAKQEKRDVIDYTERDVVIVQTGAGPKRTFSVIPKTPKPLVLPQGVTVPTWNKQLMKDALCYIKGKDQREELLGIKDDSNGSSQAATIKKDTKSLLDDEDD